MDVDTDLPPAGSPARRPRASRVSVLLRLLAYALLATAILWTTAFGYYDVFSRFSWYDDEGYLMISVQRYLAGQPLYDAVYSQYGPFYYVCRQALLSVPGAALSHDVTRLVTLATWLGIAALCAWWSWRATASLLATLVVYLQEIAHLRDLANEPGHPQEVALCAIAAVVVLASLARSPRRAGMFAAAGGLLVGCLALTKINLGAYVAIALLLTGATFARGPSRRLLQILLVAGATLLPWALMHAYLNGWAFRYVSIASLAIGGVGAACLGFASDRPFATRHLAWAAAACLGAVAAICLVVLARGTSIRGLLDGVALRPLAFSSSFYLSAWVSKGAVLASALSGVAAVGWVVLSLRADVRDRAEVRRAVWIVKFAGGAVGLYLALARPDLLFQIGPALLWLVLVRPGAGPWPYEDIFPRAVLVTVAALQFLHAYPVAGSQVAWATFLMIPASVVCVADALSLLKGGTVVTLVRGSRAWRAMPAVGTIAVVLWYAGLLDVRAEQAQYIASVPLALRGADRVRLPADAAARYFWLTANVRAHCGTLVTLPGLNSLYFWSGHTPPTGFNATAWLTLLSGDEEQQIVERLQADPNACVVENDAGVRAGLRGERADAHPVVRLIQQEFEAAWTLPPGDRPTLRIDGMAATYRVMVRRPRLATAPIEPNYFIYGSQSFDGNGTATGVPFEFLARPDAATYTLWFRTARAGVLLGCQSSPVRLGRPATWTPLVYVGQDGRLRVGFPPKAGAPMTSSSVVTDGRWHHVAVVRSPIGQTLWLDGAEVSASTGGVTSFGPFCQAGWGYTASWPEGNGTWSDFAGVIRNFSQWDGAWSSARVVSAIASDSMSPVNPDK